MPHDTPTPTVVKEAAGTEIRKFDIWSDAADADISIPAVPSPPTVVASDSMVAITMSQNPTNRKSRHIGYRLQFVRDAVDYLQTRPMHVGTNSQPADVLTKPPGADTIERFRDLLSGMGACPNTRLLFPT